MLPVFVSWVAAVRLSRGGWRWVVLGTRSQAVVQWVLHDHSDLLTDLLTASWVRYLRYRARGSDDDGSDMPRTNDRVSTSWPCLVYVYVRHGDKLITC